MKLTGKEDLITFREISKLDSIAETKQSCERTLAQLFSEFWLGEIETGFFDVQRYFKKRNAPPRNKDDQLSLEGIPEYEQPPQADWLASRRHIYGYLLFEEACQDPDDPDKWVLPPVKGEVCLQRLNSAAQRFWCICSFDCRHTHGEVSAYRELAEWDLENYPPEARRVMENIAVDAVEAQRWAHHGADEKLSEALRSTGEEGPKTDVDESRKPKEDEPKPPLLSADVDKKYTGRVTDSRNAHNRRPTIAQDEVWAKAEGITRTRMRGMRRGAKLPGEEKGGAPKRKNN